MKKRLFVLISLLIAAQSVLSPLAYALEDDFDEPAPALYSESGESVKIAPELLADLENVEYTSDGYYGTMEISIARPNSGMEDEESGARFDAEGSDDYSYSSGGQKHKYDYTTKERNSDNSFSLPTPGRVPDYEFKGWFVYAGGGTGLDAGSGGKMSSWAHTEADLALSDAGDCAISADGSKLWVNETTASSLLQSLKYSTQTAYTGETHESYYYYKFVFPLIGGWERSSDASVADGSTIELSAGSSALELYAYDENAPYSALGEPMAFDPSTHAYYVRVDQTVASISLALTASEPYADFQKESGAELEQLGEPSVGQDGSRTYQYRYSDLSISNASENPVCLEGKENNLIDANLYYSIANDGIYQEVLDGETILSSGWISQNSAEKPARSDWRFTNIALAEATASEPCNVINVVITAPDGATETTYTFYVQRVAEPTYSLMPGNTPAGMIARDPDRNWATVQKPNVAENKKYWLDFFKTNQRICNSVDSTTGFWIMGDSTLAYDPNNEGILYDGSYNFTETWGSEEGAANLDLDATALAAYLNYSFVDPGIEITTSAGTEYKGNIERKIALNTPYGGAPLIDALINENTTDVATGSKTTYYTAKYYCGGELKETETWETVPISSAEVHLDGLCVLPGVYSIDYRYTDPYNGLVLEFTRPLIVTSQPGDVDLDGVTTTADAEALRYLWKKNAFTNVSRADMRLYMMRVCNVAGTDGGAINEADISALENGFKPKLSTSRTVSNSSTPIGVSDYFYPPLESPDSRYSRADVKQPTGASELKLEMVSAPTSSSAGVSASMISASTASVASGEGLSQGSVFWVEVDVGTLSYEGLSSFTYALAYDKRYIRPATASDIGLDTASSLSSLYTAYTTQKDADWADWAIVVDQYNLAYGAGTPWAGKGYALTTASTPAGAYSTHFSKPTTELETAVGVENLSELVFSIKLSAGGSAASLNGASGCILRVPFIMHSYPTGSAGQSLPLVALDLGMQEFTVVGEISTLSSASYYYDTTKVGAYSAQSAIFGGETKNLREELAIAEDTLYLSIGASNPNCKELWNAAADNGDTTKADVRKEYAAYGTYYTRREYEFQLKSTPDAGTLPPGLTLDQANGTISGYPQETGIFEFTIGGAYYSITVQKRTIEVWAEPAESYYGEADYLTDEGYSNSFDSATGEYDAQKLAYHLRYAYDPSDLAFVPGETGTSAFLFENDRATAEHPNDGKIENLAWLIMGGTKIDDSNSLEAKNGAFASPVLTTDRTQLSPVGSYKIYVDVEAANETLKNYRLEVVDKGAKVTVKQRPVAVDRLNFDEKDGTDAAKIYPYTLSDAPVSVSFTGKSAALSTGGTRQQFDLSAAVESDPQTSGDGVRKLYNGLPLSANGIAAGDGIELQILFDATVQRNEADLHRADPGKSFFIPVGDGFGLRDLSISNTRFAESYQNYTLVGVAPLNSTVANGAIVTENAVQRIDVTRWADSLTIEYGQNIEQRLIGNTMAALDYGGNPNSTYVEYTDDASFAGRKMVLSIVTAEQKAKDDLVLPENGTTAAGGELKWIYFDSGAKESETTPYTSGGGGVLPLHAYLDSTLNKDSTKYYLRIAYVPEIMSLSELTNQTKVYKVAYSSEITVTKKEITLTALSDTHYYGEDTVIDYTFDIGELAPIDAGKLSAADRQNGAWTKTALLKALGEFNSGDWVEPVAELTYASSSIPNRYVDSQGDELPAAEQFAKMADAAENKPIVPSTGYTGTYLFIVIGGAEHRNYTFKYTQTYPGGADTNTSAAYGYAGVLIEQRPIIVESFKENTTLAEVYADITGKNTSDSKIPLAGRKFGSDVLNFTLPSGSYWTYNQSTKRAVETAIPQNRTLTGGALLAGDTLGITCTLNLLADRSLWSSVASAYFSIGSDASATRMCEATNIALDASVGAAANYRLVFSNASDAAGGYPEKVEYYASSKKNAVEYEYKKLESDYAAADCRVAGQVTIYSRPITAVEIVSAPSTLNYTYGVENYSLSGMKIRITFEKDARLGGGIDTGRTPTDGSRIVSDSAIEVSYAEKGASDSFADYGLSVWLTNNNKTYTPELKQPSLTHVEHDGARFVVGGRRSSAHDEVESAQSAAALNVKKKQLTLSAVRQDRYYGEENYSVRFVKRSDGDWNAAGGAVYEFEFKLSELAQVDRDKVLANSAAYATINGVQYGFGYATASDGRTAKNCAALMLVDSEYSSAPPVFSTSAKADSAVLDGGAKGYALTLSGGAPQPSGSMGNYEFVYENSAIYVYRRPIQITQFYTGYNTADDADRSIYSIFTGSEQTYYSRTIPYREDYAPTGSATLVDYNSQTVSGKSGAPSGVWYWFDVAAQSAGGTYVSSADTLATAAVSGHGAVFHLSADGLIGSDNPQVQVTVQFPVASTELTKVSAAERATITSVALADASSKEYSNYLLSEYQGTKDVTGRIALRDIDEIKVVQVPTKPLDSYTYGEALDLSGLRVQITYETKATEGQQITYVDYPTSGMSDRFSEYGLFINYYDSYLAPTAHAKSAGQAWTAEQQTQIDLINGISTAYRSAASGDHLSIAPLHDADSLSARADYNSFSANGKYLIITAHRRDNDPVQPKMVGAEAETSGGIITESKDGARIVVSPLELDYTLAASDKIYDGTNRAVGSVEFTNIYSGDLVYARTGASYEDDSSANWAWSNRKASGAAQQKYSDLQTYIAANGYTFASGTTDGDTLNFSGRYAWGANDTLTFRFVSPNVRYKDAGYPGATDDKLSDAYWESDQPIKTPDSDDWDKWEYEVGAMPVDVKNLTIGGPDAANYTFKSGSTVSTTNVLRSSGASTVAGQASAPYATINKAARSALTVDTLGVRPRLEIDEETGVVRLLYSAKAVEQTESASVKKNAERTGVGASELADKYASELHLEFAIDCFFDESGAISYYCGGEDDYWDTFYFGGEFVGKDGVMLPDGYVSEEREPSEHSSGSELIGQTYRWTGVDARTNPAAVDGETGTKLIQYLASDEDGNLLPCDTEWALDGGVVFHIADRNTEARSITIDGETYCYFYGYYTTERSPIPRGAYVVGKVRLAETHNYFASEPLYTSEKYSGASTSTSDLTSLRKLTDDAMNNYVSYLAEVAEKGRDSVEPAVELPGDALRMFEYRIDLYKAEDRQSAAEGDDTLYDLRTLRGVRFTDYSEFTERRQLSAALGDDKRGFYSGYYWDDRYQNALEFSAENPIILGVELTFEITREIDGESVTNLESFNSGDTIRLFVSMGSDYYNPIERWIKIHPEEITARLGDEPIELTVEFFPKRVARMDIKWSSSDESVAYVTEDGQLVLVGIGTAEITATSHYGKTSTIVVTVLEQLPDAQTGIFDRDKLAAYMGVDSDYFFYPDREMTRGEFVCLAAFFFAASDEWQRFSSGEFVDVVGDEPYAEAVKLLGEWGVIVGVGEDKFAGELVATRAEAAAIIARMLGIDPSNYIGGAAFSDSGVEDTWASGYIGGLYERGVVVGNGKDLFQPNRGITRAEAATMFYRLLNNKLANPITVYPVDVPAYHWAYDAVIRAVNPGERTIIREDDDPQKEQ